MESIRSRVHALLARLTPADKAGELTQFFYFNLPAPEADAPPGFDLTGQPRMVESMLGSAATPPHPLLGRFRLRSSATMDVRAPSCRRFLC